MASDSTKFQGKYDIQSYMYPKDILGNEYGGNYVVFHINIQSESKFTNGGSFVNAIAGLNANSPNIGYGSALGGAMLAGAIGGAGVGLVAGGNAAFSHGKNIAANARAQDALTAASATSGLGGNPALTSAKKAASAAASALEESFGALKAIGLGSLIGGALGAGEVTAVRAMSGEFSAPVKRLDTTIILNMPLDLRIRYSADYGETEMPLSFRFAAASLPSFNHTDEQTSMGSMGSALTSKILADTKNGPALSKLSKLAPNPAKELLFKEVPFRVFYFTYRFAPRDTEEAANVLNIIQQFKFHMHPEFKDSSHFNYVYPSEFDVSYYTNGKENPNIHRHTSAVLFQMDVDYTPANSGFSTFDNGMPTQIEIQLYFKELVTLDKEKIEKGKY